MFGLMQDHPLLVSSLIDACRPPSWRQRDRVAHDRGADPPHHLPRHPRPRAPARQCAGRGSAWRPGDRVATLAWNGYRHLEFYFAVSGMGAVCHTINPRLFRDQIVYIINHAEDALRLLRPDVRAAGRGGCAPHCPKVKGWVAMTDARAHGAAPEGTLCYETCSPPRATPSTGRCSTSAPRRRSATPRARPAIPRACSIRTARPCCTPMAAACRIRWRSRRATWRLPIVPMFHVNAWGIPYICLHDRREAGDARRGARRQEPVRAVRGRRGHLQRRRADGVARACCNT